MDSRIPIVGLSRGAPQFDGTKNRFDRFTNFRDEQFHSRSTVMTEPRLRRCR